jgi:hypothetical protein
MPFSAVIEQLIDVSRDPSGKARLLSGRLNVLTCPNCGAQTALATPIAYHDGEKQLLIVYVPMELGLPQKEQERVIGSFTNAITNSLPPERRRAYLLTPKMALTQQGMIEVILEADGVTPAMLAAQREKMRLVETFLQTNPAQYPELVKQNDAAMDAEFFAIMMAAAESAVDNGRRDVAEQVLQLRDMLIRLSSVGQQALAAAAEQQAKGEQVAAELNALGEDVTRDELLDVVIGFGDDSEKLEMAVSMARPAMDYEFLQMLSQRVEAATGDQKKQLASIRDTIVALTSAIDEQNEAVVKRATDTLRTILNSADLDEAILQNLGAVDELFLQVLTYNMQAAEKAKDMALTNRLRDIYEKVVEVIQASAPPQVQFINDLLSTPNFADAQALIMQRLGEFGTELLPWIDALAEDFGSRTAPDSAEIVERLGHIRAEVERVLAAHPELQAANPPPEAIAAPVSSAPTAPTAPPSSLLSSRPGPTPPPAADAGGTDKPKFEILRGGKYTPIRPK